MGYLLILIPVVFTIIIILAIFAEKWESDIALDLIPLTVIAGILLTFLIPLLVQREGIIVSDKIQLLPMVINGQEYYVSIGRSGDEQIYDFSWISENREIHLESRSDINSDIRVLSDLAPGQAPWIETNFICVAEGFDWLPTACSNDDRWDYGYENDNVDLHVPMDKVFAR